MDTGYKFKEIYEFKDSRAKEWGLNIIAYKNQEAIARVVSPYRGKFECCTELRTNALKKLTARNEKWLRNIGCETCCNLIDSDASTVDKIIEELRAIRISERSGRAQDKESAYMMQKLRSFGYM